MTKHEKVFVIMDSQGNYIAPRLMNDGKWIWMAYNGRCTGFTFYSNKQTAERELTALNDLANNFALQSIELSLVLPGKLI